MTRRDGSIVRSRGPRRTLAALLAGLALLVACTVQAPAIVIEVDPAVAAVVRGGTAEVTVTLTRLGGAADPVALAVTGLPAHVVATFAPVTLVGTERTSTLTFDASAAALDGATAVTVGGVMGTLADDATIDLDVRSLTVDGHVLTVVGTPLSAIGVSSQGRAATSAADGSFRLTGLSIPYDLTLASAAGVGGMHVFEGLTTPAPVVVPQFPAPPGPGMPTRSADLDGTVLGGAAVALDHVAVVCVEGQDFAVFGCDRLAAGAATYAFTATWFGAAAEAAVRVHALYFERDGNGLPIGYVGYGAVDAVVNDGVPATLPVALEPVPTARLQGTVAVPPAMTLTAVQGFARFGRSSTLMVFQTPSVVSGVDVLMPALPGMTYDVVAIASAGGSASSLAWLGRAGPTAGTLAVPEPPVLVAPAPGATGVDFATTFTATDPGAVRTFVWYPLVGGPQVALTTARSSVTIPDPATVGLPFAAGASCAWMVIGLGVTDVDAAGSAGLQAYYAIATAPSGGGPGVDHDGSITTSATQGFQLAP